MEDDSDLDLRKIQAGPKVVLQSLHDMFHILHLINPNYNCSFSKNLTIMHLCFGCKRL